MKSTHRHISIGHGSGAKMTHELIKDIFLSKLDNPILRELSDSALLKYKDELAFTTDSFVVKPLEFPGGDIGKLAVCGTINDLVMLGAQPQYLSLAVIAEEGLDLAVLERIIDSVSAAARSAGVSVVTGDFKVVERGSCDKMFINTSGVGKILRNTRLSLRNIQTGDKIIITGNIAQHGLAVLAKRKDLNLGFNIKSDCAALAKLLLPVLRRTHSVKFMRDPTRGGLSATLNEIAQGARVGIQIEEENIPLSSRVKAACELLGIEPFNIANEGIAVIIARGAGEEKILNLLKKKSLGRNAKVIGSITDVYKGKVILNTSLGTQRFLDMPESDPLPRIC